MKANPQIINRILEGISGHRTFCIVGHVRPDGDCIGSQLGLGYALRDAGKDVTVWNEDPMPDKLAFLDPDKMLQAPKRGRKFDCVIATDCASFERLGKAGECINNRSLFINIDHHASNTRYGDMNWVSPREPSCGELILRRLRPEPMSCSPDEHVFQAGLCDGNRINLAGERLHQFCDESVPMFLFETHLVVDYS